MILGVVSDAHCNVAALETAIEQMEGVVDVLLGAGDAVYEYRMSNEIVDVMRSSGMRAIRGNHEIVLLGPSGARARAAAGVRQDALDYLADLPLSLELDYGGTRVHIVHGSPFPPYDLYLTRGSAALEACSAVDADILVVGHTHVPMIEQVGDVLVVNPGSIGESREPGSGELVSYAIVDTESRSAEIVKFPNPRFARAAS